MVWRVLFEGNEAETAAAVYLLKKRSIEHVVEKLSAAEYTGKPILETPEGEFDGLKAIRFYCDYKKMN